MFWTLPLIALGVVAVAMRVRQPWSWAWPSIAQASVLLTSGLAAAFLQPKSLYLIFGYAAFGAFFLYPNFLCRKIDQALSLLNGAEAAQYAKKLTAIYWGKLGEYWIETINAFTFYIAGDAHSADEILNRLEIGAPPHLIQLNQRYRMTGRLLLQDWQRIIDDFESSGGLAANQSQFRLAGASRAYGELKQFEQSTKTLLHTKIAESTESSEDLAYSLLPYFVAMGDVQHVQSIQKLIANSNKLPDYANSYWLGRAFLADGEKSEAQKLLNQALEEVSANAAASEIWKKRIAKYLALAEGANETSIESSSDEKEFRRNLSANVWREFERHCSIRQVVAPNQLSKAPAVLCLLTAISFFVTSWYRYFPNDQSISFAEHVIRFGILDPKLVLHGEFWRLLTCLFLHKDEMHLLVNTVSLYWFGRLACNIFGPAKFLAVFFIGGLLSGVLQTVAAPETLAMGNSGAVMAVVGAVAAGIFRLKALLPRKTRRIELLWLAGLALSMVVLDKVTELIAGYAHFGGMVSGLALGLLLPLKSLRKFDSVRD